MTFLAVCDGSGAAAAGAGEVRPGENSRAFQRFTALRVGGHPS